MKLSPIHLAFADDHALFRKGVAGILSEYDDIEVTVEAANGGELLDKLRQTPRQPDVCGRIEACQVLGGAEVPRVGRLGHRHGDSTCN